MIPYILKKVTKISSIIDDNDVILNVELFNSKIHDVKTFQKLKKILLFMVIRLY